MTPLRTTVAAIAILAQLATTANAFCGFYVAKADTTLFNKSSKVVLAWDGGDTAITMASDFEGAPKDFAVVIPVPTSIERDQISVVDAKTIDHLDAYTAPRLVEYRDPDPCAPAMSMAVGSAMSRNAALPAPQAAAERYRGVAVEATYAVGEYDIVILSAKESGGLVNWLTDNGYKLPRGAGPVLGSYVKQAMHFFVAKVALDRMEAQGFQYLRPLQVRYRSAKFMLPLRLGTVNADGPQDLVVLALTRHGRVEATNYLTVKLPTGDEVPTFVRDDFGRFYKAMFERAVAREGMQAVFLEYAWDMGWCDPCAAAPMTAAELAALGARWTGGGEASVRPQGAQDAFVTRLHVRYDAAHFPEDLMLMETRDRDNFQGRYVLRQTWKGEASCPAGIEYRAGLASRFAQQANNLAVLTGWSRDEIKSRMAASSETPP